MDDARAKPVSALDTAFAEAVRRARQDAGLSQEDLAAEMSDRGYDFHQQTVYKLETNKRKITIGEAIALAEVLDVPLTVLTERNPESIESRRARIELDAKRLLERLRQLGDLLADARDDIDKLRRMVSDLEALDPDGRSWPGRTGAAEFFEELINYRELDGLQWAWHQFRYSSGGTALMRYFNVIPPSELPIPNYDEDEDED